MKVYFSAALAQKKQFGKYYQQIVNYLEAQGHEVLQDTTTTSLKAAIKKTDQERAEYYKQVVKWIKSADLVVLEVSFPSTLHIGHEISLALEQSKPVIALFHKNFEPAFFLGLSHELINWHSYDAACLHKVLERGIRFAAHHLLIRYNVSLPARMYHHLEKCAAKYRVPKSFYLRKLIEQDMLGC